MWKALVLKELRELAPIAALALCAYAVIVARLIDINILFFWPHGRSYGGDIPFVDDGFIGQFTLISACFAVGLAITQTLGESWRGTWLWLLYRPISRSRVIWLKLATGACVYLVASAVPIIWYACWASLPRTHPSPFFWSMTIDAWMVWALTATLYLATFWCGLWPARSIGPRWMPLLAMGIGTVLAYEFLGPMTLAGVGLSALALSGLAIWILFTVSHTRDYS